MGFKVDITIATRVIKAIIRKMASVACTKLGTGKDVTSTVTVGISLLLMLFKLGKSSEPLKLNTEKSSPNMDVPMTIPSILDNASIPEATPNCACCTASMTILLRGITYIINPNSIKIPLTQKPKAVEFN